MHNDFEEKSPKPWTKEDAYDKAIKYCNYQERSARDVRTKLITHAIYGALQEEIIGRLIDENFINDERYARSFVRGKFKYNSWGKNKIVNELKFELIPNSIISAALTEIDDEEYQRVIKNEIIKKGRILKKKENNESVLKRKIISFLVQRGFAYQDIAECFNSGLPKF